MHPSHHPMSVSPNQDAMNSMSWNAYSLQQPHIPTHNYGPQPGHGPSQTPEFSVSHSMYPFYTSNTNISPTVSYPDSYPQPLNDVPMGQPTQTDPFNHTTTGFMWQNAPSSFEYTDWGDYVSSGIDPSTGMLMGMNPEQGGPHDPRSR